MRIRSREEYDEGQLELDLGNLLAFDPEPVEAGENVDKACHSLATKLTQTLIGSLFRLPTEASDAGPLALLPPPSTLLPRAKPIPKPRRVSLSHHNFLSGNSIRCLNDITLHRLGPALQMCLEQVGRQL